MFKSAIIALSIFTSSVGLASTSDEIIGRVVIVKRTFEVTASDVDNCISNLAQYRDGGIYEYKCKVTKQERRPYEIVASQEGRPLGNGVHLWGDDTGFEFVVWPKDGIKTKLQAAALIRKAVLEASLEEATAIIHTRE